MNICNEISRRSIWARGAGSPKEKFICDKNIHSESPPHVLFLSILPRIGSSLRSLMSLYYLCIMEWSKHCLLIYSCVFRKTHLMFFFNMSDWTVCVCLRVGGSLSVTETHISVYQNLERNSVQNRRTMQWPCAGSFFLSLFSFFTFFNKVPAALSLPPSLCLQLIKLGLRSCWCRWVNIALTRCQFSLSLHSCLFRPL